MIGDLSGAKVYLVYQMWACDKCVPAHQYFTGEMEWDLAHIASTRERAEAWMHASESPPREDRDWWWHVTTDRVDITSEHLEDDDDLESWDYRPDGTPISVREADRLYVEPIFGPWDVRAGRAAGPA